MTTKRVDHDVTLSPTYLRQQLKECEAKAKLIREALDMAERVAHLARVLGQPANGTAQTRKDANKVQSIRAAAPRPLRDEIRALKPSLPRPNALLVLERLSNFPFTNSDPKKAVSDALYQLRKQGELKIISHGKGGTPNTFEWIPQPVKSA